MPSVVITRPIDALDRVVDVLVIGGGITGVSVAREAALRGLDVVMVDRGDFGAETSAATTKYIHGGIRYLEQYDIAVVRESLRERRILALGAPHLVEQTRFIMPAWRWSRPSTPLIGAGVLLYDALSFDRNLNAPDELEIPHPRWLSRRLLRRAVPWLDDDGLQGGYAYYDTLNIHPERLLLAYAKSAVAAGAALLNHVRVDSFISREVDGRLCVEGVNATDLLTGGLHGIRARVVVNATGPWIDRMLAPLGRSTGVGVDRSKGVHVLTRPLGGVHRVTDAVFARAKSGRHVIVSPWMGKSFIGPTDTPMSDGDPVEVDASDVDIILETVNSTMNAGEAPLGHEDVELTTVGVRPLIRTDDQDEGTYSASRRHELYHHVDHGIDNLWSIGGGKWTTARSTAEEMVDELFAHELHHVMPRDLDSKRIPAHGTFEWAADATPYLDEVGRRATAVGLTAATGRHLARLYGTDVDQILELIENEARLSAQVARGCSDVLAQAVFAVTHEGARTLSDVVDRRMVVGTLGPVAVESLDEIARVIGPLLGWDDVTMVEEVRREHARRTSRETSWRRG